MFWRFSGTILFFTLFSTARAELHLPEAVSWQMNEQGDAFYLSFTDSSSGEDGHRVRLLDESNTILTDTLIPGDINGTARVDLRNLPKNRWYTGTLTVFSGSDSLSFPLRGYSADPINGVCEMEFVKPITRIAAVALSINSDSRTFRFAGLKGNNLIVAADVNYGYDSSHTALRSISMSDSTFTQVDTSDINIPSDLRGNVIQMGDIFLTPKFRYRQSDTGFSCIDTAVIGDSTLPDPSASLSFCSDAVQADSIVPIIAYWSFGYYMVGTASRNGLHYFKLPKLLAYAYWGLHSWSTYTQVEMQTTWGITWCTTQSGTGLTGTTGYGLTVVDLAERDSCPIFTVSQSSPYSYAPSPTLSLQGTIDGYSKFKKKYSSIANHLVDISIIPSGYSTLILDTSNNRIAAVYGTDSVFIWSTEAGVTDITHNDIASPKMIAPTVKAVGMNIMVSISESDRLGVELLTVSGRSVHTGASMNGSISLNCPDLAKGIYILRVFTGNGFWAGRVSLK